MSFYGVQLNAQINKLVLAIKLTLGKNKYLPNFRTIYRSFIKADPDQCGYVGAHQFQKAINENGIFLKKFQIQVFQKAFSDQSGKIHWFSFMSLLREPMNPSRSATVQKIFDVLDSNNTGKVHYLQLMKRFDASEIKQFKLGFKTRQRIGEQFISLVPLTADGCVSRQQFANFYNDLSLNILDDDTFIRFISSQWQVPYEPAKKVKPQQIKSAIKLIRYKLIQRTAGTHQQFILKQIFNQFDVYKNNVLCLDQLQTMLIKLEIPVEERYTKELLQKMDHQSNGYIDFNQFKNFIFHDPYEI